MIVTSDHGEHLGDAPLGRPFDHGWTVYEPLIRTVCFMRLPAGAGGGTDVAGPTSHVDILPTVTRYLGLAEPAGMDGLALGLPGLPASSRDRVIFTEATKPWGAVETDPRWYNLRKSRAARNGRYKFIQTIYQDREELYDIAADPEERTDLLKDPGPESKSVADDLRGRLVAWAGSARPRPTHFESIQQKETRERLKSLGYL